MKIKLLCTRYGQSADPRRTIQSDDLTHVAPGVYGLTVDLSFFGFDGLAYITVDTEETDHATQSKAQDRRATY